MTSLRSYLQRPVRWARRSSRRRQSLRIYERYRDATMIARDAYVDNLEIAQVMACNPVLAENTIVECGTWRGGMAAGLVEVCGLNRSYHFFDSFAGLPPARAIDGDSARRWQEDTTSPNYHDNCTASEEQFRETIGRTGICDSRANVYKGLFEDTVRVANVGKIALLRLDGDWYDSTMCCLEALFPKIADGGFLVIDDYGTWDGCTRAVHDYLSKYKRPEAINRHGRTGVPFLSVRVV